jgi:FdhE protein
VNSASEIDSKVLERLTDLEKTHDGLSAQAAAYRALFQIQREAKKRAKVLPQKRAEKDIRDRLAGGMPLLLFEDLRPDWEQAQTVFHRIVAWADRDSGMPSEERESLERIGSEPAVWREAAEAWYGGLSLGSFCEARKVDPGLLAFFLGAALKPFLAIYSDLLMPEVDQEAWRRRYCPVCGGKPDFSVLKEGGTRWLYCSGCNGEWLFPRMECPYCGNRNQKSLAYFSTGETADPYRLYVCEECRTYLKAVDLRVTGTEILLPLERLLTLDMERECRAKGYEPGPLDRELHGNTVERRATVGD